MSLKLFYVTTELAFMLVDTEVYTVTVAIQLKWRAICVYNQLHAAGLCYLTIKPLQSGEVCTGCMCSSIYSTAKSLRAGIQHHFHNIHVLHVYYVIRNGRMNVYLGTLNYTTTSQTWWSEQREYGHRNLLL